jgi:hypothetical protein
LKKLLLPKHLQRTLQKKRKKKINLISHDG